MQEEVENRTVNLAISTTKLTIRSVMAGIRKYLHHLAKVRAKKAQKPAAIGKQTVKQLLGQNQGAASSEVEQKSIGDFQRIARKYGVDFAVRKDKSVTPPRYLVFVRAKDADVLDAICKEQQARSLSQQKHPSVLKKLAAFKALVTSLPQKVRQKKQERDL